MVKNVSLGMGSMVAMAVLLGSGCSSGSAAGTLVVSVSGEEAAVSGWPFESDGETIGFVDGWALDVTKVILSIDALGIGGADGETTTLGADHVLVDLAQGDTELWRFAGVTARRWENLEYQIIAANGTPRRVGTISDSDVEAMQRAGASMLFEGTATHATHGEYQVRLVLPLIVHMEHCIGGDGTDGIVVEANGISTGTVTVHLDHLFFDDLASDEAEMRFEAWAAAAGDDRIITLDDLASQPLADLRGVDGMPLRDQAGDPIVYDPGSNPLRTPDLAEHVFWAATTVGHWNGEGHCEYHVH